MAGPGQARFYSSTFVQTSLASGISSGATTFNVGTTSGAPGTPFVVSVDQNTSSEELMLVTNVSGLQYTVTRGVGGTSAVTHANGAPVVHVMYAQDLTDASAHIGAFDAVHGLSTGSLVVGTTDTQTLTNKTLTSPAINTPTISTPTISGTSTTGPITSSGLVTGVDFNATGLTGAVTSTRYVGGTASGGSPTTGSFLVGDYVIDTITPTVWICTVAGSPGTWQNLCAVNAPQTLTNKTINAGVFTGAGTGSGSLQLTSFMIATLFGASGNTGATASSRYMGATTGGAPTSGTFSVGDFIIDQTGIIWICTTAGTPGTWTTYSAPRLPLAPISTTSNGTTTSGTTEIQDTVLGNYAPTLSTGRTYRIILEGTLGTGSNAGDIFNIQIRDGGASAPTTGSPIIGQTRWVTLTATATGESPIQLDLTFTVASTGVHTFGLFYNRASGTGTFTPVLAPSGVRKLYVQDIT